MYSSIIAIEESPISSVVKLLVTLLNIIILSRSYASLAACLDDAAFLTVTERENSAADFFTVGILYLESYMRLYFFFLLSPVSMLIS